ncbi:SpoIID/LytB domain-containing protein [Clostridium lundense]|uniref:SpoIID/LytB domain-containing protein n=1 Tax=Clostridium lundense TaxID=319475 RepID=UPI000484DCA6|nr:SpoIID/LytB domain-containing protein [Clostridium lundense]
MKKFYTIVFFLTLLLLFILFVPTTKEHAVICESSSDYSKVYLGDKLYKIKLQKQYPIGTIIDYKYNFFRILKVTEVSPLKERIMIKNRDFYDLEKLGQLKLSKHPYYYYLDKNNRLTTCTDKKLIVGQNNIKSYTDKKNNLKTFIITPVDFSYMRVGISNNNFNSLYHDDIEITCMEDSLLYNFRENFSLKLPKSSKVNLKKTDDEIIFTVHNEKKVLKSRSYLKGNNLKIDSLKRGNPHFIPCYSGIIEFTSSKDGILMTNEVNIEDYLCKVVPSEMPSSGGIESLKCQAIAARTYAISDMLQNRFSNLGFYVDDSTQSQVYNNIETNTLANDAVRTTSGLIMTYNNTPIDAKYYSSSSGMATAYEDVWFNSDGTSENKKYYFNGSYVYGENKIPASEADWLNFYKNKDLKTIDSDSPYFRWYAYFPKKNLEKSLNKSLKMIFNKRKDFIEVIQNNKKIDNVPELSNLKNISIAERSKFGNIICISFEFSNATVNVKGDLNIRNAIRCNKDFSGETIPIVRHKKDPLLNNNFLPSSFFSVDKVKDGFKIYGGGYGHGVGMSQFGAIELSKNSKKYNEILNKFYKDVSIDKIY